MSVALSASNLGAGGIEAGRRAEHDGTAINHGEAGASYISSMALRSTPSTSAITPPRISAEAHEMRELGLRHETAVQGIAGPSRTASHQTDTSRSGSIRSAQRGIINEDAVHPSESRLAGEAGADTGANPGVGPDANEGENGTDAARMVRRNLLRACWSGFVDLGKGRKIVLMLRLAIALAQVSRFCLALFRGDA